MLFVLLFPLLVFFLLLNGWKLLLLLDSFKLELKENQRLLQMADLLQHCFDNFTCLLALGTII